MKLNYASYVFYWHEVAVPLECGTLQRVGPG